MNQNDENEDSKEINFNIFTDVNSNINRYEYSNDNFIIIFSIENSKFIIEIENKLSSDKYQKQYTQDELISINKVFSMFDSVEDCINIIEMNKNNFLISIQDNICSLTIKVDTKELPKNKISDTIVFKIPLLLDLKQERNSSNMSLINRNLRCLKIESNISLESLNNASPHNSIRSGNNLINSENTNNIIQNLISKIDILTQENKEIKERLNVLEENNNKLINLIKENRINSLKEKNKSNNFSFTPLNSRVYKNDIINNQIVFNNNFDFGDLSLSISNEQQGDNQNILKKVYSNFLKNKTKNKLDIEDGLIHKMAKIDNKDIYKRERKKSNASDMSKKDEDNYFFSNKTDVVIKDDLGIFKQNEIEKIKNTPRNIKEEYNMKNIINIDEAEEERKNKYRKISNFDEDEAWSVNKSYNMVGATCLNDKNKNKKKENNSIGMELPQNNFNNDGYLY